MAPGFSAIHPHRFGAIKAAFATAAAVLLGTAVLSPSTTSATASFGDGAPRTASSSGSSSGGSSSSSSSSSTAPPPPSYASIRGINYVPSYSQHPLQTLLNHDPFVVHQEMEWLGRRRLGFNAVRIFLNYLPWQRDPDAFFAVTDDLVAAASENGMRVLFTVFDSTCGAAGDCDATQAWLDTGYFQKVATWVPCPGPAAIANATSSPPSNATLLPVLEAYATALVSRYANDSRLLGWDMHNEPDFDNDPNMLPFVTRMFALIQQVDANPDHVATTGLISASQQPMVAPLVRTLSFHDYDGGGRVPGANLAATIAQQQQFAASVGKGLLLTECMGRPNDALAAVLFAVSGCVSPAASDAAPSSSSAAAAVAASSSPPSPIGFFLWEAMAGRDQFDTGWFPYQGLLYPTTAGQAFAGNWLVPDEALWWEAFVAANATAGGTIDDGNIIGTCPVPAATTREEIADTDPRVTYMPAAAWTAWRGAGPRAGSLHYTNASDANVTVTLPPNATSFSVVHKSGPDCGVLRVVVDGEVVATIDTFTQQPVWGVEAPAVVLLPPTPLKKNKSKKKTLSLAVTDSAMPTPMPMTAAEKVAVAMEGRAWSDLQPRVVTVQSTGTANPLSSDTYTQVVGFNAYA
jgi:hypothetical protein